MNNSRIRACIALGSNLGNPLAQVSSAATEIAALPQSRMLAVSRWYRNPAQETAIPQPDFINAAVLLETTLRPLHLLEKLQHIETRHGRMRSGQLAEPRILDLDLLLYGNVVLDLPGLKIPHPKMKQRSFVLYPLQDIAPDLILPDGTALAQLLHNLPGKPLQPMAADAQARYGGKQR